ncbi:hypothetical protein FJTKL_01619 [Diaporthe vaccinii]|uniref:Uncharacterized protein n=1 Tax=Diaporthe vaccinii TaxID=105482 RepID=A0ABR4E032_9PEZI
MSRFARHSLRGSALLGGLESPQLIKFNLAVKVKQISTKTIHTIKTNQSKTHKNLKFFCDNSSHQRTSSPNKTTPQKNKPGCIF